MEKVGTRTTECSLLLALAAEGSWCWWWVSTPQAIFLGTNTDDGGCQEVVVVRFTRNSTRGGLISPLLSSKRLHAPFVGSGSPAARIAGPSNPFRGCKLLCILAHGMGTTNGARHGFYRASTSACDADLPGVAQLATTRLSARQAVQAGWPLGRTPRFAATMLGTSAAFWPLVNWQPLRSLERQSCRPWRRLNQLPSFPDARRGRRDSLAAKGWLQGAIRTPQTPRETWLAVAGSPKKWFDLGTPRNGI